MEISKRTLRRMENISDICDFDTEKGVATLHLYFDKAEEILDKQQSTPVRPVISAETIERMSRNMCIIPEEFDVVYAITVDDYQDYTPDQLLHAYKTGLENRYYRKDEENRTDHAVWFLFALVGLAIFMFMVFGKHNGWFGAAASVTAMVMAVILDMLFQSFFEKSIIFYFVHDNRMALFKKSFRRLDALQCRDRNGKMLSCWETKKPRKDPG